MHRRWAVAIAVLIFAAMWIPIHQSALAPAEIVPFKPTIVRAPLDGVVDHFDVEPNQTVTQGQVLLSSIRRAIENKLEVATQGAGGGGSGISPGRAAGAVRRKEPRSSSRCCNGRAEQRRADVTYAAVAARPHPGHRRASGLAIFDEANDWIGRPVTIGERLLEIADPAQAELEVWLPVADAITLEPGAEVEFFLNIAPERRCDATLRQTSYEATSRRRRLLGYRLKAELADSRRRRASGCAAPPRSTARK